MKRNALLDIIDSVSLFSVKFLQRLPSFAPAGKEVDEKRNEEPLDWHHFALSFFLSRSPPAHIKPERERREMSNSAENCGQSINDCLRRVSLSFGCSGAAEWQTSEQAILTLRVHPSNFILACEEHSRNNQNLKLSEILHFPNL
jgi:hypothetical protein